MAKVPCNWCEKTYTKTHNSQLYCNKRCTGNAAAEKIRLRQKEKDNLPEPRPCRRCHTIFQFKGMKKYCLDCLESIEQTPDTNKKTRKDNKLPKKCIECNERPRRSKHSRTKYCEVCAPIMQEAKVNASNLRQKEELANKVKQTAINQSDINPMWLSRGPISNKGQK